MSVRSRGVFAVIVTAWFAAEGLAQEPPGASFNVDTNLVLVPATVTDSTNRFVLNLRKQDFHLFEDGSEQKISHFSGEDAPLSVGVIFDTSGSMGEKLRTSRQAAVRFLETMNPQDEAFLVEFGDTAELTLGFTNKIRDIEDKLTEVKPGGLTALLDAAEMALHEMKKARNPRKAIVIISDGGDNNSKFSASEIQSLVREADVQIYAMGVFEPLLIPGLGKEVVSGPRLLAELAEQTGGRAFTASDPADLPSVATRIGIELRNQYVLAYSPSNRDKDGKYRKVEIKLEEPAGMPHLKVRWRLGYYAPTQ
jgi:Ca-activated chloride channel family protein